MIRLCIVPLVLLTLSSALAEVSTAWAQLADADVPQADVPVKEKSGTRFMRIERDMEKQPTSLETAIVSFVPAEGEGDLIVDLVGAVHVGDKAYYERLNKEFEKYDVVLYELVAPEGTRIPKGGRGGSDNPISLLQTMTKSMLELESQTDLIDYTKENFVHADLSPEGLRKAMQERGESGLTLFLSVTADMLRQANLQDKQRGERPREEAAEADDPLALLFDPQRGMKLKRSMAEQFEQLDALDGGLGATLGRLLVADRNAAAMKVFQKELAKGKKRIAIYYGAAHMPDFQRRLTADFGLKPSATRWVTAWDLTKPSDTEVDPVGELLKRLLQP